MLTQGRVRRAVSHIQFSREIVETKGVLYCLVVSNPSVTLTLSCMCDLRGFYIIGSSYTQSCILSLLLRIFGFVDGWPKLEKWFTKFGIFQRIDANTSQGTCNNKTVVSSVITPSLSLPPPPPPYSFQFLTILSILLSCLSRCYDIIIPVVHSNVSYKIVHCRFFVCVQSNCMTRYPGY